MVSSKRGAEIKACTPAGAALTVGLEDVGVLSSGGSAGFVLAVQLAQYASSPAAPRSGPPR